MEDTFFHLVSMTSVTAPLKRRLVAKYTQYFYLLCKASIGGSVVEFSPATRETGVRFPANAKHVFSLSFDDLRDDTLKRELSQSRYFCFNFTVSIGRSVAEYSCVTRETWVRFPANARHFFHVALMIRVTAY